MNLSRFTRTIQLGVKSILLHKLRSGLTILGIVFGVFSVIAMLAIGEGASKQAQQQVLALGAHNVIVRTVKPLEDGSSSSNQGDVPFYGLLRSDYDRLMKTLPTIKQAIPIRELEREGRYLHRSLDTRLVGCTPAYFAVNHLHLARGRLLTDMDLETNAAVAVIAHETAMKLFLNEDPLGQSVQVGGYYYEVVGVTEDRVASAAIGGNLSGQDYNKDVYIPLTTLRVQYGDLDFKRRAGQFSSEQVELNQITFEIARREDILPTAEIIEQTLKMYHTKQKDYAIVVPLELIKQADQLRQIFNVVLGSIAAISLVVGGIGIMNIMLATVTERTREIGIRRALGARQVDITYQFLTETVVLSGSGGILGVILGLLTPHAFLAVRYLALTFVLDPAMNQNNELFAIFTKMQPEIAWWSLPLAFGISVGVGVVFGLYPARSAAQLDPIEALRHT